MSRAYDRRFHAEEFGPFDQHIRKILERVAVSATPVIVDISKTSRVRYERYVSAASEDGQLGAFARNKNQIRLFFAEKLAEAFLAGFPSIIGTSHLNGMALSIKSEITLDSIDCFTIVKKSESEYYVILPFASGRHDAEATVSAAVPIKPIKRPSVVGDKAFPAGGNVFLVTESLLGEILNSVTASILTQEKAAEAACFGTSVRSAKARIGSDLALHDYTPIYTGESGIAWGGSLGSMFSSFFEPKPKHNLDRVLRLLKNYLNPFKQLGHSHTDEVRLLITNLDSIRSVYEAGCKKGSSNAMMDAVIFDKLKDIFISCESRHEEGSLMRRLIFTMDQILPGIGAAVAASGSTVVDGVGAGAASAAAAGGAGAGNPFAR